MKLATLALEAEAAEGRPAMIFKWGNKNKVAAEATEPSSQDASSAPKAVTPEAPAAEAHHSAGQMARELFEKVVPFKSRASTHEDESSGDTHTFLADGGLGQQVAIESLRFGAAIKGNDYNILVAAPRGIDGAGLVRSVFKGALKSGPVQDWIYVPCLSGTGSWSPLALPRQRALSFKTLIERALGDLQEALPDQFASETYQLRRLAIDEMHGRESDGALTDLIHRAAAKNVAVLRLPQGFSVAPMHEGKVVRPEVLQQLPETMRREVDLRVRGFQSELEALLKRGPHLDRARRSELRELHEDIVAKAASLAFADVREAFSDVPQALARLDAIAADLKAHASQIVSHAQAGAEVWRRYGVVVMRSSDVDAAPILELHDVSRHSLTGRLTHGPQSGALHQANGGALLLSADAMLHDPDAREVLVRTLISREITLIGDGAHADPIPFDAKIVLIGEPETCDRLFNVDPRLKSLFKLRIELRQTMPRTKESEAAFAETVQALVSKHKTKPISAAVTALLLAEASRAAKDDGLISLALEDTADLLREASAWAEIAGDCAIEPEHVTRALKARDDRRTGGSAPSSFASQGTSKVAKALGS